MPDRGNETWGIIPAAGVGSRIQPLGFSKELLPVGTAIGENGARPRAVCEYLIERMVAGGADKLCFVIGPGKSDILEYVGEGVGPIPAAYVVQPRASGLCDAIFRAASVTGDGHVIVGLPDTIWFPADALAALPADRMSFLLFPVDEPQHFDAVSLDRDGRVVGIEVKHRTPSTNWIWGAFKMPGHVFRYLRALWIARNCRDEYIGTLVNAYLGQGGHAVGVKAGESYVDVGTLDGYHQALMQLAGDARGSNGGRRDRADAAGVLEASADIGQS